MESFSASAHGHDLTFYPGGAGRLAALLKLINNAQYSLKLFYYIFAVDETASTVRDALTAAVRRGVKVTLILDSFGSEAGDSFLASLSGAGGRVLRFSPGRNVRYLVRNHQKMTIADGAAAIVGGFNIENAYFDPPEADGWLDLGIEMHGPVVGQLAAWFDRLENWTADPKAKFLAIRRLVRSWDPGTGKVQVLVGGPTRWLSAWARRVTSDFNQARQLDMIAAYFAPRARMVRLIARIAQRGTANLVLAAKSDNAVTIGAARSLYSRMLSRGVKIYEFEPCKLHTKLIVVDDVVYFGSANFDMRSLYLNLELMLRIEDAALAEQIRRFIAAHFAYSTQVTPQLHDRRQTIWKRIRWKASWFLVTVVDYTVTRRLNLGL